MVKMANFFLMYFPTFRKKEEGGRGEEAERERERESCLATQTQKKLKCILLSERSP